MVNVAIAVIVKEGKILLIKRERGNFIGLYGLPGGKVEECEHIDVAVQREIQEELGLDLKCKKILGVATEIMHDKGNTVVLYCCKLDMDKEQRINHPEFQYKWFSKEELINSNEIIESDKLMIENFYFKEDKNYLKLDCYKDEAGQYYWK